MRGVIGNIAWLPVIWTMLIALGLRYFGYTPPGGVTGAVQMVADASIPMLLLALGIQLGYAKRVRLTGVVIVAVALKQLGESL